MLLQARDVGAAIVDEAIALGATEIDVIMCSNPDTPNAWDPRGKKAFEVALRAIDLMGG